MRPKTMTKEQRKEWQRLLSGYLQRQRLGLPLTYADAFVSKWHFEYTCLMNEKLKILRALEDEDKKEKRLDVYGSILRELSEDLASHDSAKYS